MLSVVDAQDISVFDFDVINPTFDCSYFTLEVGVLYNKSYCPTKFRIYC